MTNSDKDLTARILERLGHVELDFKNQGLVNHANGARICILAVMKVTAEGPPPSPIEPSDPQEG